MATILDETVTKDWYERLPQTFRDLDDRGDLYGYLRTLGDYAGGLRLLMEVLEGYGFIRPIPLPGPCAATVTVGSGVLTVDGTVFEDTVGGVCIPLAPPVTDVAEGDPEVLVVVSGDWILTDLQTVPAVWLPWLAQVLSVDLAAVQDSRWRDWLGLPVSRYTGSLASIQQVADWHLQETSTPVVERDPEDPWLVTVTVPEFAITTSLEELQAAVTAVEPAGVRVVVVAV